MTIKVGDRIPAATVKHMTAEGIADVDTAALFAGKTVVMFGLPGAFTPTCSAKHLPGFVARAGDLEAKGTDLIVCMSVNDAFVMEAWGRDQNVGDKVMMLADGNGDFTRAMGLKADLRAGGMGERSQRFALIAKDRVVTHLAIEPVGGLVVSASEKILEAL